MAIAPRCVQSLVHPKLPTHRPLSLPGTSPRPTRRVPAPPVSAPARPISSLRPPRQLALVDWPYRVDWIGPYKGSGAHRAARGRRRGSGCWAGVGARAPTWGRPAQHAATRRLRGSAEEEQSMQARCSLVSLDGPGPARLSRERGARPHAHHTRQPPPGSRRPRRPAQPLDELVLARVAPYRHSLSTPAL